MCPDFINEEWSRVEHGEIVDLKVTPKSRQKDVVW